MSKGGCIAFVLTIAAIVLLLAQDVFQACLFFFEMTPPELFATGIMGWAMSTFGPLALSALCWSLVKRVKAKWAPHLFFIPCVIALERMGESLLLYGRDAPYHPEPIEYTTLWGTGFLIVTLLVHATSLIVEVVKKLEQVLVNRR